MSDIQVEYSSLIDRAALGFLQSKKLLPGFSHYDVWLHEHAVAFTVAKMMDKDMLADVQSALVSAIENGTTFDEFKKRLKPYLMARGWWGEQVMIDPVDAEPKMVQLGSTRRLRTIFQTNLATSHAAGQWARIQSNKRALPYIKYIPSVATHKRDSHRAYYHLILPVEHELWQTIYPPNGYGCLCSVRQLTRRQALRERAEDIEQSEAAFTKQQIENSKKGILDDQPNIPMVEFTNPRTKQTVQIPADITPTFAHNHGDRLGAIQALLADKHGTQAAAELETQLDAYLSKKIKPYGIKMFDFSHISVEQSEIDRLADDPNGKEKPAPVEALVAAKWQEYFKVKLERPLKQESKSGVKTKPSPDFVVIEADKAKKDWHRIDLMFTLEAHSDPVIFLQTFNKSEIAWGKRQTRILKHLNQEKADTTLMYLDNFDALTRAKVIRFVLELPEAEQKKIVFVRG